MTFSLHPRAVTVEDISGWRIGAASHYICPQSTEKITLHYITPSARKHSRGTLGCVQQALITVLKARGSETS